jgi:feruloyl esterase
MLRLSKLRFFAASARIAPAIAIAALLSALIAANPALAASNCTTSQITAASLASRELPASQITVSAVVAVPAVTVTTNETIDTTKGQTVPASANNPAFCQVSLTLAPSSDSDIHVLAWLPETGWNGRFLGTGNGGYAGALDTAEMQQGLELGFAVVNTDMGTDLCTTSPDDPTNNNPEFIAAGLEQPGHGILAALYCRNLNGHPEKWVDWGNRSTHLMTVVGKTLVNVFYAKAPSKSYFNACSTGGRQSLMEAERFPTDYDGILAGDPAFDMTHLVMSGVGTYRAVHGTSLSPAPSPTTGLPFGALSLINQTVLKQCTAKSNSGGLSTDGFLTDPRACNFKPASLQCSVVHGTQCTASSTTAGSCECLSADQAASLTAVYSGTRNPQTGALINPGSELGSEEPVGPIDPAFAEIGNLGLFFAENNVDKQGQGEPPFDGLLNWVFGPNFQWQNFDFDFDIGIVDAFLEHDINATSTDLSAFNRNGSKFLLYHGFADPLISSNNSINYFNALIASNGGDRHIADVEDYFRLFMAPGLFHCDGGPGANSFGGADQTGAETPNEITGTVVANEIVATGSTPPTATVPVTLETFPNTLSNPLPASTETFDNGLLALVNWVENGIAPTRINATKYTNDAIVGTVAGSIAFQRPLCVYPNVAQYTGPANPSPTQAADPANFTCGSDGIPAGSRDPTPKPAPIYGP